MSTLDRLPEEVGRAYEQWVIRSVRRWAWLLPGLVAGVCVYAAYLATHAYPAFGAGLFLAMAERVVETFPVLPAQVDHYTARGVPLAYPPLMFYVTGFVMEATGLGPFAVAKHVPHLVSIVALVPLYLFAEELLGSRRGAGLATLLAATAPPLLQWQVSGGGIVRAPAYLFMVVGLYTGLRLFRDRDRRWVVPSLLAFGLTVLSHPVYTVFFVLTYLTMYAAFDVTFAGLARGAAVGVGGLLLASPWWGQVVTMHGLEVLMRAAGTHGGIGQQLPDLLMLLIPTTQEGGHTRGVLFAVRPELFDFSSPGMAVLTVWSLAIIAAWSAMLWAHRRVTFLTGWILLAVVFVSKPRFSFLIGAVILGAVLDRQVLPALRSDHVGRGTALQLAVGVLLFVAATTTGVAYAGSQLDTHAGSTSQPEFVDDHDVAAMEWVAANTDSDETFVVLGDAAEWFPYRTDRTMLVGPWGVEWRGRASYQSQLNAFNRISTCGSAACLDAQLNRRGAAPDYVYVPKGLYTVRGFEVTADERLHESLADAERFDLIHENPGVAIYAYEHADASVQAPPAVGARPTGSTTTSEAGTLRP